MESVGMNGFEGHNRWLLHFTAGVIYPMCWYYLFTPLNSKLLILISAQKINTLVLSSSIRLAVVVVNFLLMITFH